MKSIEAIIMLIGNTGMWAIKNGILLTVWLIEQLDKVRILLNENIFNS